MCSQARGSCAMAYGNVDAQSSKEIWGGGSENAVREFHTIKKARSQNLEVVAAVGLSLDFFCEFEMSSSAVVLIGQGEALWTGWL